MTNPMETYERIKKISPEAKADADAFMKSLTKQYTPENPAPPEVIQKGLEGIISKYETKTHSSSSSGAFSGSMTNLAGLAAVLAGIALFAGIPYVPPPLY